MSTWDFYVKTNEKNIQSLIKLKVDDALRDYSDHVEIKRNRLRNLLELENLQNEEKLLILEREFKVMYARKREMFEKETNFHLNREREKFLKSKEIQRETENSEKLREAESQKFLKETKIFQLKQIEEKKQRLRKLKEEDEMWLNAGSHLHKLHDHFEMHERLLKKGIRELDHDYLVKQLDQKRDVQAAMERDKVEEKNENQQSVIVDRLFRNEEMQRERYKKIEQCKMLDEQLKEIQKEKERLRLEKIEYNRQFELSLQQMKEAECRAIEQEKAEIKESTSQYLRYIANMKREALEKSEEQKMDIAADNRFETNNKVQRNKGLRFYMQNLQR